MDFDDYKTPTEESMRKMSQEYARLPRGVRTMQNNSCLVSTDKNCIFNNFDWSRNSNFFRLLCARSPNNCIRNFVLALSNLSEQDMRDLRGIYPQNSFTRLNPTLETSIPNTFNSTLREFVRNEIELLLVLNNLQLLEEDASNRQIINNIITRRLEALGTLAGFFSGGFFM